MTDSATPRLQIPELVSMQEANVATWNGALVQLDAFVDLFLLGQFTNTPPSSPSDGDAYLIGGSPTGVWSGYSYKIASCIDGAWRFYTPFNGLRAYVATTGAFVVYVNGVWTDWNSLISANEASIASAATCDLGAAGSLFVAVTGTTTVTGFGTSANRLRFVRFAGALTLTHNATSLILLGGASRTTAAGDLGIFASDASGNWRERAYLRAAADPGDYATKSGTETFANKTLTAPKISTISNTGTLTLPTSTDTLVGRATTDTLTNKTLTSPAITTPTITGVTDGSSAAAGKVGEYVVSTIASGSAVSLTTATTANVTSIALTAGDWDVTGLVEFIAASATVAANAPIYAGLGSTSATLTDTQYSLMRAGAMTTTSYSPWNSIDAPIVRLSLTATTTIYLQAQATFTAGTMTAYGTIRARRVR
ncbi:MAG: DUF2793 domain-containing protein [Rhizomicrobium sp.]